MGLYENKNLVGHNICKNGSQRPVNFNNRE